MKLKVKLLNSFPLDIVLFESESHNNKQTQKMKKKKKKRKEVWWGNASSQMSIGVFIFIC